MYEPPKPVSWRITSQPPPLDPTTVHLWRVRTGEDGEDPDHGLTWLAPPQRERAARLRDSRVRARFLRAQIGLRRILAAYVGCHPRAIELHHEPRGKPYLAPHLDEAAAGLQFNLTTTGDLALVAVGSGMPLGVDCEQIRPRSNLQAIAERMFAPAVVEALASAPEALKLAQFHLAWTALEADVKADGRGLFRARPPRARPPTVAHCTPAPGYVAAVAREGLAPPEGWLALELCSGQSASSPDLSPGTW